MDTINRRQMYVIIICATLPTLRQFYLFARGRSYHNSKYADNSGSNAPRDNVQLWSSRNKHKGSRERDEDLFLTTQGQGEQTSSQENILGEWPSEPHEDGRA